MLIENWTSRGKPWSLIGQCTKADEQKSGQGYKKLQVLNRSMAFVLLDRCELELALWELEIGIYPALHRWEGLMRSTIQYTSQTNHLPSLPVSDSLASIWFTPTSLPLSQLVWAENKVYEKFSRCLLTQVNICIFFSFLCSDEFRYTRLHWNTEIMLSKS